MATNFKDMAKGVSSFLEKNKGTLNGINEGISALAGMMSNAGQIATTTDTSGIINDANALASYTPDAGSFDSLEAAYPGASLAKTNYTGKDLGGKDAGDILLGIGSGGFAGAAGGGSALGSIIGGVGGMAINGIAGAINSVRAKRNAEFVNSIGQDANARAINNYSMKAGSVHDEQFSRAALNFAANGGQLDLYTSHKLNLKAKGGYTNNGSYRGFGEFDDLTSNWDNGVTIIGEGGTHEQNPYNGVLFGVDEEGTPNLVEEGEVIFNDYVYSNRLSPTKEMLDMIKLPKKYADKPFSKIAKALQRESQITPNDPIAKNGLEDSMEKLRVLQESVRQGIEENKQEEMNYNALGGNLFAGGGKKYGTKAKVLKAYNEAVKADKLEEFVKGLNDADFKFYKEIADDKSNALLTDFANQQLSELELTDAEKKKALETDSANFASETSGDLYNSLMSQAFPTYTPNPDLVRYANEIKSQLEGDKDKGIKSSGNIAHTAPVWAGALQTMTDALGLTNKEDYTNADIIQRAANNLTGIEAPRIGGYKTPPMFDTHYNDMIIGQQGLGTQRAILGLADGNRGAAMNGLLASAAQTQRARGESYRQGLLNNAALDLQYGQYNNGINQINAQNSMAEQSANQRLGELKLGAASQVAQLRDAIETATSTAKGANATAFLNNAGLWGKEMGYMGVADDLYSKVGMPGADDLVRLSKCGGKIKRKK